MIILSLHDGHNASAALLKDGKVLSCVSEERINRKKFYWGWPKESIDFVLRDTGTAAGDIDVIAVSHMDAARYARRKFSSRSSYNVFRPKIFLGNLLNIWQSIKKERAVRSFRAARCPQATLFFCDHHYAHAASAYYASGARDALVVTCDNLGDSRSHTAYSVTGGVWKEIVSGDSNESLGAFYAAVTEGLGFKPNQHEGKLVGLAAYASPDQLLGLFRQRFAFLSDKKLHFQRMPYRQMVREVRALLSRGYTKEQIASATQTLLEEIILTHINALLAAFPHDTICLAGGVFANVKLNQRIKDTCKRTMFIQPAMGDEGLVLGCAWAYLAEKKNKISDNPLVDVYWGTHFTTEEIEQQLTGSNYCREKVADSAIVANLVASGAIVGIFDGRMEFGPRALGGRSIVADPRNKEVNDVLNKRLRRSDFMPFAPSVLAEYADDLFEYVGPARHAAEFMTITFDVKKEWRQKMPAIVHVDGTARPQLVRKDRNERYWRFIDDFREQTGIPLLMNTSFNMHEEPIVSSPSDALRSLDAGAVDAVLFNYELLVRLGSTSETLSR